MVFSNTAEGRILYEKADNCAYVYDMITQSQISSLRDQLMTPRKPYGKLGVKEHLKNEIDGQGKANSGTNLN